MRKPVGDDWEWGWMLPSSMTYQIHIPPEFYDSCKDDPNNEEPLTETCGEYIELGSYDFLIGQARYFTWPRLTKEVLAGTLAHEDAHNTLAMGTALGHLELHIKTILELTSKIPPTDKLAQALRKYLAIIIGSSVYTQETAATMSAYTALRESYGSAVADQYLKSFKRPSPYTRFVDRAIMLFGRHRVPHQHWGGYMMFLASLSMNTDIDEISSALPNLSRFEKLCARSPMAADLRFERLFGEFEESIEEGGLPTEKRNALERSYNRISNVVSSDIPRLLAEAILYQATEFGLLTYEKALLKAVCGNPFGYPGKSKLQTIFYAAQPKRKVTSENYLFRIDDDACAKCNLVEMGMASFYENVMYGGININLYVVTPPPVKTGFWMLHPCCAIRCHSLLDNKTIVVYFTLDLLEGYRSIEPIRKLIAGHRVIYIFFGNHRKFLSWFEKRVENLIYTIADVERPPIRFILLRERGEDNSIYVLPVAPVSCEPIDSMLSTIKSVTMSEFADARFKADLDRFFIWYIFAPVTS